MPVDADRKEVGEAADPQPRRAMQQDAVNGRAAIVCAAHSANLASMSL
jgi:hypothetical protein